VDWLHDIDSIHFQAFADVLDTNGDQWDVFDRSVTSSGADFRVRRLRTRDQFLALLFGQLSGSVSLRAIEDGFASSATRLYHAGARPVSRSTLADANAKRPFEVYRDVFAAMVKAARPGVRRKLCDTVRLIDATKGRLPGPGAAWARFSRHHCSAKIHTVYDPNANLPRSAVVTPDNVNDITPAKAFAIEPGATYVFDLAYYSYEWWKRLDDQGCRFVTRLKTNTPVAVNTNLPVPAGSTILSDRIAHLPERLAASRKNPFVGPVREITVKRDHNKKLRLVTNDLDAPAEEIAALYKQRWEIELFFKWIKQNLKIKHFIGVNENSVKTQIYIALIAFVILRAAHNVQKSIPKPQAFARLVRLNIMQRRDLFSLIDPPNLSPKNQNQMTRAFRPC